MKKISKLTTENNTKTHTTDEVKRYLGALSEDFQHKVSVIGEQFGGLNKKLDEHTKTLDSHTKMIGSLMMDMTMVKEDVSVLKKDMVIVKEDISVLKKDMITVKEDVKIIKNDLNQKIDRNEFEPIVLRISAVENKVMQ